LLRSASFDAAIVVVGVAQLVGASAPVAFGLAVAALILGGLGILNSWELILGVDTPALPIS
jgi:hypothetical protein